MTRRATTLVLAAVAATALLAGPALGHEHRGVGGHELTVGWLNEPAYAGYVNAVQLVAEHSADHEPVEGAQLTVAVIFGGPDGEEQAELALEPAFGAPGEYHAPLIPTRPGTYTFHVTGTLGEGEELDEVFTSGADTFNDIQNPADAQFPVQDPNPGELAQRAQQSDERVRTLSAELEEAKNDAARGMLIGWVGVGVGIVALLVAALRRPRTPKV